VTVTSLASQFSDVTRIMLRDQFTPSPPAPFGLSRFVRNTRIGQTIWCSVNATNITGADVYLMFRPTFALMLPEFVEAPAGVDAGTIKRLDVVGSPSPFGSSISQMLGEIYRFLVPAGQTINAAFFLVAEGMRFNHIAWCTNLNGDPLGLKAVNGYIWSAVGSPRAAMTSGAPEAAGGES
jgi:hypothetical protein